MINLYLTLGVSPAADDAEIKRVYRNLSKAHHPDRGGDAARFAEIAAAYQVLGDPAKREAYDTQRQAWLDSVGAVGCPACGEANRIRRMPKGKIPICAECRAELPQTRRSPLAERAAEMGLDLAERGLDHTAALLAQGVDLTFEKLRQRIRTRLRGGR